jgi:hypothetical protein
MAAGSVAAGFMAAAGIADTPETSGIRDTAYAVLPILIYLAHRIHDGAGFGVAEVA